MNDFKFAHRAGEMLEACLPDTNPLFAETFGKVCRSLKNLPPSIEVDAITATAADEISRILEPADAFFAPMSGLADSEGDAALLETSGAVVDVEQLKAIWHHVGLADAFLRKFGEEPLRQIAEEFKSARDALDRKMEEQ